MERFRRARKLFRDPALARRLLFSNIVSRPQLADIGKYYGTDKANKEHSFNDVSYLDIFERYFHRMRDNEISLLEIGVRNAESLRTWKSYFKSGHIFGIDIDPGCKYLEEDRMRIETGSQDDIEFLSKCFGGRQNFDIVIDDGSHVNRMIMDSFEYLFNNRLNPGGIYIIEDLMCSYEKLDTDHNVIDKWPGMKYNNPSGGFDNNRKDIDTFFLEKIRRMDHLEGNIMSIHFWAMVCIITKC